jgi:hypothetical protein
VEEEKNNQARQIAKDWKKQVADADELGCINPENAVSTAWHLAILFNKFSDDGVFYRVATRDAIDYMVSDSCEDVHSIIEKALKAYKSWGKVKFATLVQKQRYPVKCQINEDSNCEDDVNAIQITGYQYQVLTSAQDETTGKWDIDFLQNVYGVKKSDFEEVINWCNSRRGIKAQLCNEDMPTAIAIGLLYGQYPESIEDWRLSVRLGLSALKFPNQYLLTRVFKVLNLNVSPIEIFMINTY